MTTRILLYNDALTICGERAIASLTEDREARRLLDHVWDNGGVKACLEAGQWLFARRAVMIDYDPDIDPGFGYQYAFQKPSDWCNTAALCEDEYFNTPLTAVSEEAGYWYADVNEIYVKYTSDDASWGGDLASWPQAFADYVAAYFASRIILKLSGDKERFVAVDKIMEKNLLKAKNHNAMSDATKFPPKGSWVRSRGRSGSRDRGNTNNLTG